MVVQLITLSGMTAMHERDLESQKNCIGKPLTNKGIFSTQLFEKNLQKSQYKYFQCNGNMYDTQTYCNNILEYEKSLCNDWIAKPSNSFFYPVFSLLLLVYNMYFFYGPITVAESITSKKWLFFSSLWQPSHLCQGVFK